MKQAGHVHVWWLQTQVYHGEQPQATRANTHTQRPFGCTWGRCDYRATRTGELTHLPVEKFAPFCPLPLCVTMLQNTTSGIRYRVVRSHRSAVATQSSVSSASIVPPNLTLLLNNRYQNRQIAEPYMTFQRIPYKHINDNEKCKECYN
jgi:hypothetical protein